MIGICLLCCVTWYASKYVTLRAVQQQVNDSPSSIPKPHTPILLPKLPPISIAMPAVAVPAAPSPPPTPVPRSTNVRLPDVDVVANDPGGASDFDVRDVPMFTTRHQLLNSDS